MECMSMRGSACTWAATGGGADPFTGGSAQSGRSQSRHIPQTAFLIFDNRPAMDALARKLREFNASLVSAPETARLALSDAETAEGGDLDALLGR
jgi:hypothetical protein